MQLIKESYYFEEDTTAIARDLLGKILVSSVDGTATVARIVETEAYKAPHDKGSHAYGNKRTKRTATMFDRGGHAYIYLCYGIHHLCNVVTGPNDMAHAVLIRAVEPLEGKEIMGKRRGIIQPEKNLTNGPGKWTKAMGISTKHNREKYFSPKSLLQIFDAQSISEADIIASPRVGIAYAKECAHWPWRFYIDGNPFVSLPKYAEYPSVIKPQRE